MSSVPPHRLCSFPQPQRRSYCSRTLWQHSITFPIRFTILCFSWLLAFVWLSTSSLYTTEASPNQLMLFPVLRLSDFSQKCLRNYKRRRSHTLGKALSGGALDSPMMAALPECLARGRCSVHVVEPLLAESCFQAWCPAGGGLTFGGGSDSITLESRKAILLKKKYPEFFFVFFIW